MSCSRGFVQSERAAFSAREAQSLVHHRLLRVEPGERTDGELKHSAEKLQA
jgi:hypothetical protein